MTNIFLDVRGLVIAAIRDLMARACCRPGLDLDRVAVEPPRDPAHGDLATNAAMVLAGAVRENPMALAERIGAALNGRELVTGGYRGPGLTVAVARPGFLNITLAPEIWHAQLRAILRAGAGFGDSAVGGGERVNVEFVSANPTGPMHVGQAEALSLATRSRRCWPRPGSKSSASVLQFDDAGAQVDILARSTHLRYREALGEAIGSIPDGYYPGEYLIETGQALARRDGRQWLDRPESDWLAPVRDFAVAQMMALIREDLVVLGVRHDLFVSERALVERRDDRRLPDGAGPARLDLYRRAGAAEGRNLPMIGSRGRNCCSAPPNSATRSTVP